MTFHSTSWRTAAFLTLSILSTTPAVSFAAPEATAKTEPSTNQTTVAEAKLSAVENSVVKVFATARYPDVYKPWTKSAPSEATGTGVVIEGKRILSNAHVVLYASQVQIQANQSGEKLSATVEAVAPGIDLAILKLDDETFFDTHPPLPRANKLPEIKDAVMAYGYPEGGTSLSITKGIVSRIEFVSYNYPASGLRIQIDAAINPGNSGGPAVADNKMIGLAFSHLGEADNIGYIIPCEEIELFLHDLKDGHYDGKPAMHDDLQTLENPALRSFLKADKSMHGIVVHRPLSTNASYPIKQWDIITKIGKTPVDDEGMIQLQSNLRVHFLYLVQEVEKQGKIPLTIVRGGKEMAVELPVTAKPPRVIDSLEDRYPSYFIYGPVVFTTATTDFLRGFVRGDGSSRWISWFAKNGSPLLTRLADKPAFDGEGLVVVPAPFFPHKLSKGYSDPYYGVVSSVNGIAIKNLNHLVEVLRDCKDEFIAIEFESRAGEAPVFPRAEMLSATDDILTDNGIRSQGSADTMAIWNAKAAR